MVSIRNNQWSRLIVEDQYPLSLRIFLYCVSLLILSPILTFPLFGDQAIFARGAQVILNGGTLYVDYLDLKSPMIYYLYVPPVWLFGISDIGIRCGDFLYNAIAIYLLIYTLRCITKDDRIAYIASLLYPIGYVALGFAPMMFCETLIASLLVLLIRQQIVISTHKKSALILGITAGIICSVKYTLGLLLPAIILYTLVLLHTEHPRVRLRQIVWICIGFGTGFLLGSVPLLLSSSMRQGYSTMLSYLFTYNATIPFDKGLIRVCIKETVHYIGNIYSMFLFAMATFAMLWGLYSNQVRQKTKNLIMLCALLSLALFVSVSVERRFWISHFTRIYVPMIILSSIGLLHALKVWLRKFLSPYRTLMIILTLPLLLFTPLPRYVVTIPPLLNIRSQPDYSRRYYAKPGNWNFLEHDSITTYIKQNRKDNEKTLFIGMVCAQMYLTINESPWTVFSHSQFYYAKNVPTQWVKRYHEELRLAEWVTVFVNDSLSDLNGHNRTSWQSMQLDSVAYPYLCTNFKEVFQTSSMKVWKRNDNYAQPNVESH